MRVQSILHLSEAETMAVTHFERGNGLISTNNNNVTVEFKASEPAKLGRAEDMVHGKQPGDL